MSKVNNNFFFFNRELNHIQQSIAIQIIKIHALNAKFLFNILTIGRMGLQYLHKNLKKYYFVVNLRQAVIFSVLFPHLFLQCRHTLDDLLVLFGNIWHLFLFLPVGMLLLDLKTCKQIDAYYPSCLLPLFYYDIGFSLVFFCSFHKQCRLSSCC